MLSSADFLSYFPHGGLRDLPGPNTPIESALLIAARDGEMSEMRRLIKAGAPVDARDAKRNLWFTPLSWAAYGGWNEGCAILLEAGAKQLLDACGRSPLALASWSGHFECVKILATPQQAALPDDQGWTPLMRAAAGGRGPCARLLAPISNLAAANFNGWRAIAIAAAYGQVEALAILLANAGLSDIEALDAQGCTPLMRAAGNGQRAASMMLIRAGANPEPWGAGGPSAHEAARKAGWQALAAEIQLTIDADGERQELMEHLEGPLGSCGQAGNQWL